jgi:hypothetical protein
MKIDLKSIDETQFLKRSVFINGEEAVLVQPQHIGAKFTQKNKMFRSSVFRWGTNFWRIF